MNVAYKQHEDWYIWYAVKRLLSFMMEQNKTKTTSEYSAAERRSGLTRGEPPILHLASSEQ